MDNIQASTYLLSTNADSGASPPPPPLPPPPPVRNGLSSRIYIYMENIRFFSFGVVILTGKIRYARLR